MTAIGQDIGGGIPSGLPANAIVYTDGAGTALGDAKAIRDPNDGQTMIGMQGFETMSQTFNSAGGPDGFEAERFDGPYDITIIDVQDILLSEDPSNPGDIIPTINNVSGHNMQNAIGIYGTGEIAQIGYGDFAPPNFLSGELLNGSVGGIGTATFVSRDLGDNSVTYIGTLVPGETITGQDSGDFWTFNADPHVDTGIEVYGWKTHESGQQGLAVASTTLQTLGGGVTFDIVWDGTSGSIGDWVLLYNTSAIVYEVGAINTPMGEGEIVTGFTSGATGIAYPNVINGNEYLIIKITSGEFQPGEFVIGSDGGNVAIDDVDGLAYMANVDGVGEFPLKYNDLNGDLRIEYNSGDNVFVWQGSGLRYNGDQWLGVNAPAENGLFVIEQNFGGDTYNTTGAVLTDSSTYSFFNGVAYNKNTGDKTVSRQAVDFQTGDRFGDNVNIKGLERRGNDGVSGRQFELDFRLDEFSYNTGNGTIKLPIQPGLNGEVLTVVDENTGKTAFQPLTAPSPYMYTDATGINRYPDLQSLYNNSIGTGEEEPRIVYFDKNATETNNGGLLSTNWSGYQWIKFQKSGKSHKPQRLNIQQEATGPVMDWRGFPSVIDSILFATSSSIGPIYQHTGGLITELRGNGGLKIPGNFFSIAGDSHIIMRDRSGLTFDGFIFNDDTSILEIHCYDQSIIGRSQARRLDFNRIHIHIYSNDVTIDATILEYGTATIFNHTGFNIGKLPPTVVPDGTIVNVTGMTYDETTRIMDITIDAPLPGLAISRTTIDGLETTEEGTLRLSYCPVLDYNAGTLSVKLLLPENYAGPLTYITGGEVYSNAVTYLGTFRNMLSATYTMENTGVDDALPCLTFRNLETGDVYQPDFLTIGGVVPADRQTGILTINNDVDEVVYDIYGATTSPTIGTQTGIAEVEAFIDLSQIAGPDVSLTYKSLRIK